MSTVDRRSRIEAILHRVEKPARYVGGEWNQIVKDHHQVRIKMALCFPDVYEIGMSHLGFRLLYAILNCREDMLAERAFTPWPDMQRQLIASDLPLTTLETCTPLHMFDVLGFSLQYELCFTNVLSMLHLGGVPLRTRDRQSRHPLVIAGGPVVFNPEPLADFIDAFVIGDGEETAVELAETFVDLRKEGVSRGEILLELSRIPGIYVPSLYGMRKDPSTGFQIVLEPLAKGVPYPVERRILMDLDSQPYPTDIVVPFTEVVHDRVSIEIMRGCQVGCRFCQAGYIYRPVRERSHAAVMETARRSLASTGYDEVGLTSSNSGEYPGINRLLSEMMDELVEDQTAVSFSSLRANSLTDHLAKQIKRVRKTGFTIAPEAGTDRMRRVINKNISEADVLNACEMAFSNGWRHIKLYFMIGQPTERWEDVEGILEIGQKALAIGRRHQGRRARISLSASSFIPKPFTPFQWCRMASMEEIQEKQNWLKKGCDQAGIHFKWHHPELSRLEGVFSLGDRRLCDVVEKAWEEGCSFDGWTERLDLAGWTRAFAACGIDPESYLVRDFGPQDALPWDHLDIGVTKKFLARELRKAIEEHEDETCGGDNCYGCAPFASSCTGFLHERRTGDLYFGGIEGSGPVASAVPGGGVRLPALEHHRGIAPRPVRPMKEEDPAVSYWYRARFLKLGAARFLSHLDLVRALSRAFRRAGIRLAYSQGFHPMPRLAFGPALPVGTSSRAEYLDFESLVYLRREEFLVKINKALPAGLRFLALAPLERGTASLSKAVNRVVYGAVVPERLVVAATAALNGEGEGLDLEGKHRVILERFLARESIPYRRRRPGKISEIDLRRFLLDLSSNGGGRIRIDCLMENGRTAKPHEILDLLYGEGSEAIQVTRLDQMVMQGDKAFSPLLAGRKGRGGTRDSR
ncbi:MAG: TIGR03960 family B12-binding radical SAM protein [Acidobacteriota bacterium]